MTPPFRIAPNGWRALAAISSGLLLAAAFPPLEVSQLAWFALIPLLAMAIYTRPRAAFQWGFVGGLVFWLSTLSWLLTLSRTGGPWPLVLLGWVSLSAYCALYVAAFAMVASVLFSLWLSASAGADAGRVTKAPAWGPAGLVIIIPLLWVGFEYLRGTLFTGFPWNAVGGSQFSNLILIQGAEWGGVYVVSAVIVLLNTALTFSAIRIADALLKKRQTLARWDLLIAILALAGYCLAGARSSALAEVSAPGARRVSLAAIQPNIPQLKKWSSESAFVQEIFGSLRKQTEFALAVEKPNLILWPETAVPGPLLTDPETADFVDDLATNGVPLLVGAMEVGDYSGRYPTLYNSSFLVTGPRTIAGVYRKLHLVPFGEYLPFDRTFSFVKRFAPLGFSCTPGDETTVFQLERPAVGFSALICFEDIFPSLSRNAVRGGARFLVNQTNDGWFDGSCGARQHLSQCVFRAVENRVGVVRVANTGITCFIEPSGKTDMLENGAGETRFGGFKLDTLPVPEADMSLTFYTRYGDLPFALPCGVAAGAAFALVLVLERRKMGTRSVKEKSA